MKVFFSTDWTLNDSLLTEVDNIITLHPQEVVFTPTSNNVCLMAHNELGEIIATSGCGEEEPLITEGFIRFWAGEGFPAEMDIDVSLLYMEDYFGKLESNQLPEIPSEIITFTDKFGNVYDSFQQMLAEEGLQRKDKGQFLDFINNEGEHFSQEVDKLMDAQFDLEAMDYEARKNLKKHTLVKKANLQPRVDFQLLVNSSSDIWNAGHLLGISEDPNNPTVKLGQDSVKNLMLFFKLMSNPKFATRASFEIEKILNK